MFLLFAFLVGVLLVVFGVLFIFFPTIVDDLSAWTSQVIINVEDAIQKGRRPLGFALFLLGALLIWLTLTTRNRM